MQAPGDVAKVLVGDALDQARRLLQVLPRLAGVALELLLREANPGRGDQDTVLNASVDLEGHLFPQLLLSADDAGPGPGKLVVLFLEIATLALDRPRSAPDHREQVGIEDQGRGDDRTGVGQGLAQAHEGKGDAEDAKQAYHSEPQEQVGF